MDRASAWPESPEESAVEVNEAELAEARARLQASLEALHTRIEELTNWRAWLRRHPMPFLLGAFGLGAVLGYRWRRH